MFNSAREKGISMDFMGRLRLPHLLKDVRGWWRVIVLLVAFLALGSQPAILLEIASPAPQPDSPALWVGLRDGLLSVEAKEGSWVKLLKELSQRTGILFHLSIPLEGSVTASFKDLPVEQALKRLFGPDANLMFLYNDRNPKPASLALPSEVWVLSRGRGKASETVGPPARKNELASSTVENTEDPNQEIARAFETNPQAAREAALGAPDPEIRLMAIAHLGQQATQEAVSVLMEVVQDPDPHIRQTAVDALGPLLGNDPQVRMGLAHVMQTAADPDIRQLAADALGIPLDPMTDKGISEATTKDTGR